MAMKNHGTLTAATVTTETVTGNPRTIEVVNVNGASPIYYTLDGSTPTVGGDDTEVLPAAIGSYEHRIVPANPDNAARSVTVKLISAGTPTYAVVGRS